MRIPDAALQQHIAVLGKTGSGKTYAAKAAIVEPLLEAGRRVGIVDPTGAWWGLRSSRDGKAGGFPILVLGGDHGDMPLTPNSGEAVARLLAEQNVNLVADTSQLTVGERTRWFISFAGTLFRANRAPLHLVIDEAHYFAPQGKVPDPDTGKMLHAAVTLASGGRSRGIRLTMISQRAQKLHKDALTSADALIAMRVIAPQDRKAIKEWVDGCAGEEGGDVIGTLASLAKGEGWVWYPEGEFLQRMRFPAIRTFDSSATPTDGGHVEAPRAAAEIDLTEIRAALVDAVKEAEENDPKLLRKRIAELEARGASTVTAKQVAAARAEGEQAGRAAARKAFEALTNRLAALGSNVSDSVDALQHELAHIYTDELAPDAPTLQKPAPVNRVSLHKSEVVTETGGVGGGAKRRMMIAMAPYRNGIPERKVAILADVKRGGSSWRGAMAALRKDGHVLEADGCIGLSPEGLKELGKFEPLPHGEALREHWMRRMGAGSRAGVFAAILAAYPRPVRGEDVAAAANVEFRGSSWRGHLAFLRGLELVTDTDDGRLLASEDLFE